MKFLLGLLTGLAAGAIGGYVVSKKQFEKDLKEAAEKLEAQYQQRLKKELEKKTEEAEKDKEKAVVEALKKVEDEDKHMLDGVDINKLADEEEEDDLLIEGWDPGDGSEFVDEDAEWDEYLDSIKEYVGTNRPYNITEEMFSEENLHYRKQKLYLCIYDDPDTEDYAYDPETGETVEDFHNLIGDEAFDTLSAWRCDNAAWFIRNDGNQTDYMVQYQNSALLH